MRNYLYGNFVFMTSSCCNLGEPRTGEGPMAARRGRCAPRHCEAFPLSRFHCVRGLFSSLGPCAGASNKTARESGHLARAAAFSLPMTRLSRYCVPGFCLVGTWGAPNPSIIYLKDEFNDAGIIRRWVSLPAWGLSEASGRGSSSGFSIGKIPRMP